jgi:exopolysaccharide biosynthesis polyprenyl glycosylphosphotransferase
MALFFLLSVGLLAAERGLVITCYRLMLRRGYFHRNLFIVGTGPRTAELIRTIRSHVRWGIRIIGLLDEDLQRAVRFVSRHKLAGVATVGTLAQLPDLLRQYAVDEVVFVVPRSWMSRIEQAVRACELAGVRATVAVDLFNLRVARSLSSDLNGIPLISFDTAPTDQWQLAVKRVVDVSVSSLALLILLPLLPLVALVVKATSPGPILFRQIRCGLNGRRFTLYKLRSMAADAEAKQAELAHLNELNGPVFKATNDPRLTPIGKWLRKTSIDELPQLVNVLKGEMSLVGPRPPLPSEVEQYEPWQRRRLSMRPGITGYWQVNGRNHIRDFDKWMALDLEYIDRWSLGLDLKILLKTVPAVLVGKGAK